MKKIFIGILLLSSTLFAQYNGERTTEQNFEESSLYFKSHFLNPVGIGSFKDVAPGMINNPFLNLSINPANMPNLSKSDILTYIDFRGDRTEAPIVQHYIMPLYTASIYRPYYDPRWFSTSRVEPEPVVSIGIITNPVSEITKKIFIGGTFQFIHGEDKYYQMPYSIYNVRYAYDAFGATVKSDASIPIQERYTGKDEMITDAKLYSLFAGYKFSNQFSAGVFVDGVVHSREGGYGNSYSDEYGNTDNSEWSNSSLQNRDQNYHHIDFSGGLNYSPIKSVTVGFKAGILSGKAEQAFSQSSSYYSKNNTPNVSTDWYYNYSDNSTMQNWNHDGTTKYLGVNFSKILHGDKSISFYYKYSHSNINLSTASNINDTSNYSSRSTSSVGSYWSSSESYSYTHDNRTGSGKRIDNLHQFMLNFKWKLTEKNTLKLGFYISSNDVSINSDEPVFAVRESMYNSQNSNADYNHTYYQKLIEDKTLVWNYNASKFTFQIPILIDFRFGKNWGMMLGINRIYNEWNITDKTIAYFKYRDRTINSENKRENNFGESYTQPAKNISEKLTKIFTSFDASITRSFKARLTIDPDFESFFRISQWWLSFEIKI